MVFLTMLESYHSHEIFSMAEMSNVSTVQRTEAKKDPVTWHTKRHPMTHPFSQGDNDLLSSYSYILLTKGNRMKQNFVLRERHWLNAVWIEMA